MSSRPYISPEKQARLGILWAVRPGYSTQGFPAGAQYYNGANPAGHKISAPMEKVGRGTYSSGVSGNWAWGMVPELVPPQGTEATLGFVADVIVQVGWKYIFRTSGHYNIRSGSVEDTLRFSIYTDLGTEAVATTVPSFWQTGYHSYVFVRNYTNLDLYRDGAYVTSTACSNRPTRGGYDNHYYPGLDAYGGQQGYFGPAFHSNRLWTTAEIAQFDADPNSLFDSPSKDIWNAHRQQSRIITSMGV